MRARPFADQVVWITGASSGIGRAQAVASHQAGARVIVSARRTDLLEADVHDRNIRVTVVVPGFIRTSIPPSAITGGGGPYGRHLAVHEAGYTRPNVRAAF